MFKLLISYLIFTWIISRLKLAKIPKNSLNCGIAALTSNSQKPNPLLLRALTMDNMERGIDSAGITNSYGLLKKKAVNPLDFLSEVSDEDFDAYSTITHTRHSTMKSKGTDETAHPFLFEKDGAKQIIGVHNGWLINSSARDEIKYVSEKFGYNEKDFDVDSKIIYYHMSMCNPSLDGIANSISDIEGAMALVWFDYRDIDGIDSSENDDPVMFVYRRSSKPLYYVDINDLYNKDWYSCETLIDPSRARDEKDLHGYIFSSRKEGFNGCGISDEFIKEVEVNKLHAFRRGNKILDFDVEFPEIEIDLDQGPTSFNSKFLSDDKFKKFHTIKPKKRSLSSGSEKNEGKALVLPLFSEGFSPVGSISPYSCMTLSGHYIGNSSQLENSGFKNVTISNRSVKKSELSCIQNESVILVKLQEKTQEESPLFGWRILVDGHPETISVTKKNGICGIYIPDYLRNENITICVHPPSDYYINTGKDENKKYSPNFFFSCRKDSLFINESITLELTMKIPFVETVKKSVKENWIVSLDPISKSVGKLKNIIDDEDFFTKYMENNQHFEEKYEKHKDDLKKRTDGSIDLKENINETYDLLKVCPSRRSFSELNKCFSYYENTLIHKDVLLQMKHLSLYLDSIEKMLEKITSIEKGGHKNIDDMYDDFEEKVEDMVRDISFITNSIIHINTVGDFIWSWESFASKNSININTYPVPRYNKSWCKLFSMLQCKFDVDEIISYIETELPVE